LSFDPFYLITKEIFVFLLIIFMAVTLYLPVGLWRSEQLSPEETKSEKKCCLTTTTTTFP
jgi:hypothetical protein